MPIKVLVISDYRNYHSTRPEASIFKGLAKMGFQIFIMTYGEAAHAAEFREAGIRVLDFHPENKLDKSEIRTIRRFIQKEKIDILHLFNSKAIVNGIQAARGLPVKVILYRGYTGNIHWYDPTAYFKYLHPRVDVIHCNSRGVEEHLQKQWFFDKKKTVTINKGHNVEWYQGYEPHAIREELGISPDSFLLINVANNRRMKGIPFLLKAFHTLPDDLPIHLLLAGRHMDNRQNLRIINRGRKKDNIHLLGHRKDVLNIVAGSDVFVLPSIKGESITKSVLEAMSLGIAPILTDISGNEELVVQGESGLVVPARNSPKLSEAILQLYGDPVFRKKLGENAQKRIVNRLNHEQTIQSMKRLYERLVKE
jgi:glycosyltransferase involved in cell wall biosynthesis